MDSQRTQSTPILYSSAQETTCSLNFASRVATIELGQAKKNVETQAFTSAKKKVSKSKKII